MSDQSWLLIYIAAMAGGAILFGIWSRNPRDVPQYEYYVAMLIPIWSGLAYTAMAFGQGIIEVEGQTIYLARYLDWLVTTPLLLFLLASTGMFFRPLDKTTISLLIGLDVIMILSGLFADLTVREPVQWFWYAVGCICLAAIVMIVWGRIRREAYAHDKEIGDAYTRVAAFLSILWVAYPLIWALGPSGLGIIGRSLEVALFVIVPIVSKVGFSIYDLTELRKLAPKFKHLDEENVNARLRHEPAGNPST